MDTEAVDLADLDEWVTVKPIPTFLRQSMRRWLTQRLRRLVLMTDVDEHLLTFAKLREVATGDLDGDERLGDIATYGVEDPHRSTLQFLEANADQLDASVSSFAETELGQLVTSTLVNEAASQAVQTGDAAAASAIVGVTETSFDGSTLEVTAALLERLRNDDAPTFVSGAGDPESGKTNTLFKLVSMTDHLDR
ncbi:MAG: hypothetical protein U5K37_01215 [Natrialbaceae archaeon]|nr:hypothetical protein [Natrialbaceae archaeon]